MPQGKFHVAVLGAGIVGATAAIALLKAGHAVTLVEPDEPGGEQAASYGNAGWFSPASVVPMSMPGLWRKVPSMLADPLGPLTIRWTSLPHLFPWLTRFLLAGATESRVRATARALRQLIESGPERHQALAREAGVPQLVRKDGAIYAYPDRQAFEAEALAWDLRRENGIAWTELADDALWRVVPSLATRYRFGAHVMSAGHCLDPGGYVGALAAYARRLGAQLKVCRAHGFAVRDGRLTAVETDRGPVECDKAVIAAGIQSADLARAAGDRPLLRSERGYHVVVAGAATSLSLPVQTSDSRIGTTPMTAGIRSAGQVELCAVDRAPDWRRAEIVLRHLKNSLVGIEADARPETIRTWMGHRPSTPDGLPVIGVASRSADIVHAYGHGHVGMGSAPMTAEIVRDLVGGIASPVPLAPYSPQRFGGLT